MKKSKGGSKVVMGSAGKKTIFAMMPKKGKPKDVNNGSAIKFNVSQFHAKKGNTDN